MDTIARWLSANIKLTPVSELCKESVGKIYATFTETEENYRFLPLEATVVEALMLYEENERRGIRLDAILFTPLGFPSIDIQAIMTTWDIPKALNLVELGNSGSK